MVFCAYCEGVWIYWELLRYTADVGEFIQWQWRKSCVEDLGTWGTPWAFFSYIDDVPSSLGGKVAFATTSAIVFLCLVEDVPPRGKFEICVEFDPIFHPFWNFHDRSHNYIPTPISLEGLPESLRDNLNCGGWSHHHGDDVEGICGDECRKQLGTGDDEVKHENSQPEPVSTSASSVSLVLLTVDIG